MVKRQKWTDKEDGDLQELVTGKDVEQKWDIIAYQMEQAGHHKTSKQCRER